MPSLPWKQKDRKDASGETDSGTTTSKAKAKAKATPTPTAELFPQGIKVLQQPLKADVDIVFVHGLTGDRERTWMSKNGTCWPQSLLPGEILMARVMTYGYDAYFLRKHGPVVSHRIRDHAVDLLNALASSREADEAERRPIIFVVHSLGGLVCKDALLVANRDPERHLQSVFESTRGIVFMATPHSGSALADMARLPMQVFGLVRRVNSDLVSVLETQSEVLERIQSDFLALLRNRASLGAPLNIICYYESLPMPKVGIIVPKESATLPGYLFGSIRADHRDVVRYESADDPGFVEVVSVLKRWTSSNVDELYIRREAKARFLRNLAFPGIDARRVAIGSPAQDTCSWVFEHPLYQDWKRREQLDRSNGLLWIKGKPGPGKSVLMKQIVQTNEASASRNKQLCLSFFFNARGAPLERSPTGLYRSLLHQLIAQLDFRKSILISLYIDKETKYGPANITWSLPELRDLFYSALLQPKLPHIMVFVDALDECAEDDVREIVRSFEECALKARKSMSQLDICWSSRHYPHISVKTCYFELRTEDQNAPDIASYIKQQLLSFATKDFRAELLKNLTARASGVFLWVVLVIRKLLIAEDKGRSLEHMRTILRSLPSDLDGIFREIIQSTAWSDRHDMLRLVQWVLFASRPLTARELRIALEFSGPNPPSSFHNLKTALGDELGIDHRRFKRRIIDLSGGLMEISTSDRKSVVQVIHESVRDFLLGENGQLLFGPKKSHEIMQEAHQSLAGTCGQFISWTDMDLKPQDLVSNAVFVIHGQHRSSDCRDLWLTVASDSFLKYALGSFFTHVNASESDEAKYSEDMRNAIRRKLSSLESNVGDFAFHGLSLRAFQTLVTWNAKKGEENLQEYYTCLSSLNGLQEWIIKSLAKGIRFAGRDATEIFTAAAHLGLINIIQAFCEAGYPVFRGRNCSGRTALHTAVLGGSMSVTELLVCNGTDLNVSDSKGKTPLFYAIKNNEIEIVSFLLASGCAVNYRDEEMRTPLQDAASLGRVEIVKALIEFGADVTAELQAKARHKAVDNTDGEAPWKSVLETSEDVKKDGTAKTINIVEEKEKLALASDTRFSAALFSAIVSCHPTVEYILREAGAYLSDEASRIALGEELKISSTSSSTSSVRSFSSFRF